jgi:hypothetical protein
LRDKTVAELTALSDREQKELAAYRDALSGRKPGYRHLLAAQKLVGQILEIDPQFGPANNSQRAIRGEVKNYETNLNSADALIKAQRFDDGFAPIVPYLAFADEDPRVAGILHAAYSYHLDRGR